MQTATLHFKRNARQALANPQLQHALGLLKVKFVTQRANAAAAVPNFEDLRRQAATIREHTLQHLATYLTTFEKNAQARGVVVHWAETPADVQAIVLDIARQHQVRKVIKSKSMVSEEVGLNAALEAQAIEVIETDLGEYIIQLAKDRPSHILAPAIHKSKAEISDLFAEKHARPRQEAIEALCQEAREMLRPHFLSADMGISGANFLIAETGSALIVTNEGNGRLTTTLPKVHVAITGIEKVVPTLEDAATLLRVLTRSATGQSISNYVSLMTGTQAPGEHDGPQHMHVILVDNGRSPLLGSELQAMLRCIRCGACMNHCPVYQNIGGHAYGWVYPGPMGSVLTPAYLGTEQALDLPHASTFCGACEAVCPVKIPLPHLLRQWRTRQFKQHLRPKSEYQFWRTWQWLALHPQAYAYSQRLLRRVLRQVAGSAQLQRWMPRNLQEWSKTRDFPRPARKSFREQFHKKTV